MKLNNAEQLQDRWAEGDREAFGELFKAGAPKFYNFAYRLTGNPEETRDIIQSAALRALSGSFSNKNGAGFDAWMHRIILNLFRDKQKARSRAGRNLLVDGLDWEEMEFAQQPSSDDGSPRKQLEESQRFHFIERALEILSPEHRSIVVLRDIEGFSYEEISQIEDIPVETVRTRLRRARARLRDLLKPLLENR